MSKKNKQQHKVISTPLHTIKEPVSNGTDTFVITDLQALLITLVMALISYIFSFYYTSFYQGEEGAQYMNALSFWHDKNSILGNWPKTGWKIIYAPIVLLGKQAVLIANCLFSAFTGFWAYKLASKIIDKKTALPFILLISQTLWFILSFKFYSEIPTAFFLTLAIYLFYSEKFIGFALCASFVLLLRQEFVFIFPYFAFVLFRKKHWLAFFALGTFPFLYNIWGWQATGDILYALNESRKYAASIKDAYPRQGFDHYLIMSGVIYNLIVLSLVVTYLAQIATKQIKQIEFAIIIPALGFILVHCLFNLQAYPILTSTGGNLRYLLVVSPLMAVLATIAIYNFQKVEKKVNLLLILIPFIALVAAYMTYTHNWVVMDTESGVRDRIPVLLSIIVIGSLYLIKAQATLIKVISGLCVVSMFIYIQPKELCCDENYEQKKITEYVIANKLDQKPIIQNLALMDYFYGKNKWDYPAGCISMSGDSTLDQAKVGTIVIWDTHYATKYGKVEYKYFEANAAKYKMLKDFKSEDNRFAAVILEKIKP
ncbi:MAG: hypothetical protein KGZ59_07200 [Chitinophagaceae bacterium]|nr:hypothetical protein [Chitinophagaceae bacterium]